MSETTTRPVGTATAPAQASGVTVRHYCQGIGDCHLLTFKKSDGTPFRMLIDCGVHVSITGGPALVNDILTKKLKG